MQYALRGQASAPDPATFEQWLHRLDTAALVDRDPVTGDLRVSSVVSESELFELLRGEGFEVRLSEIARLPSECCGGCGG